MYIGGIHVSNEHLTEGFVTSSLLVALAGNFYKSRKTIKYANEEGGPIKSLPTSRLGKVITPIHAAAMILPPVTYLIAIPLSGGVQPSFISRFSLPKYGLGDDIVNGLRVTGAIGLLGLRQVFNTVHDALGQSFHFIGVREKPKIVTTGPFAIVRHPLYTTVLVQQLVLTLAFWNWIPLVSSAIVATAFVVKIPIEEKLIESDPAVGPEYVEYKKKVPYRLIPKVW